MSEEVKNTLKDNRVYILSEIEPETTNELIENLARWVDKLTTNKKTITDPKNSLKVYINSCGGCVSTMQPILTLFDMANSKGAIIQTYNLGEAASAASLIAIYGTKGHRYMSQNASNFIHFGYYENYAIHANEINIVTKDLQNFNKLSRDIYLEKTNLTNKELTKYYNIEGAGKIYAKECLEKGLCDWVITTDGRCVNKPELIYPQGRNR